MKPPTTVKAFSSRDTPTIQFRRCSAGEVRRRSIGLLRLVVVVVELVTILGRELEVAQVLDELVLGAHDRRQRVSADVPVGGRRSELVVDRRLVLRERDEARRRRGSRDVDADGTFRRTQFAAVHARDLASVKPTGSPASDRVVNPGKGPQLCSV